METNFSCCNTSDNVDKSLTPGRIIIGTFLVLITSFTVFGNILVLVAVKREKQLQTKFNTYIVNLAVTDLTVALSAMSFYTADNILGYWPFGKFLCGVWIFNDYGMTFASVFTIIVISIDRFWAVTWPNHYKNHHTKKKCAVSIAIIWICMVVLWLPSCIVDRLSHADIDGSVCIWDPALNQKFVIVIAIIGHHGSFFVILFCYIRVFYTLRTRNRISRRIRPALVTINNLSVIYPSTIETKVSSPETKYDDLSSLEITRDHLKPGNVRKNSNPGSTGVHATTSKSEQTESEKKTHVSTRDRRAFVTLTYIIIGYVICWFPFHIVFDVSAVKPDAVSQTVYLITFWLTYINSTINPFLYNFSNPEFRKAFKKILLRRK
ncbi:alpha-1A adrenergic receptor-like [Mytilus galloprovincialis]|uniref:alpha-1A adrenergic receptor-like n=1 Tax=Mytilus galloprovincialis TaxID=29158 RepID=UPI003F7B92EB